MGAGMVEAGRAPQTRRQPGSAGAGWGRGIGRVLPVCAVVMVVCFADGVDGFNNASVAFARYFKVGSTTMSGILLGMRQTYFQPHLVTIPSLNDIREPFYSVYHRRACDLFQQIDDLKPRHDVIRISLVRSPEQVLLSSFYHLCLARKQCRNVEQQFPPDTDRSSDAFKMAYLSAKRTTAAEYIAPCGLDVDVSDGSDLQAHRILSAYHFVAVTERFRESLLVLKHLFRLTFHDILHFPAKRFKAGDRDDKNFSAVPRPPRESDELVRHLRSLVASKFAADAALHRKAWEQLDKAIDLIGRDQIKEELAFFDEALRCAREKCKGLEHEQCLLADLMCGYHCFHRIDFERDCGLTPPPPPSR